MYILGDCGLYWGHRIQHEVLLLPFLSLSSMLLVHSMVRIGPILVVESIDTTPYNRLLCPCCLNV